MPTNDRIINIFTASRMFHDIKMFSLILAHGKFSYVGEIKNYYLLVVIPDYKNTINMKYQQSGPSLNKILEYNN